MAGSATCLAYGGESPNLPAPRDAFRRIRVYALTIRAGFLPAASVCCDAGACRTPASRSWKARTGNPLVRRASRARPVRIVISRTRPPACAEHLSAHLGATLVSVGSAGAKAMAVLRGHSMGALAASTRGLLSPSPWPATAGLHVSRLEGTSLHYNSPGASLPDLLVCRAELAATVRAALSEGEPARAEPCLLECDLAVKFSAPVGRAAQSVDGLSVS